VSVKTVYNAIDLGELGAAKRRDLWRREGWKKENQKPRKAHHTKGLSIELRPPEVDERGEQGHWEGDLVVSGKNGKGAVLTLTERLTREEIICKIPTKEQIQVAKALESIGKSGKSFKSVTWDNGSEFLDYQALQAAIPGMTCYYAHPYSSFERGFPGPPRNSQISWGGVRMQMASSEDSSLKAPIFHASAPEESSKPKTGSTTTRAKS
jgi:IS30 family transposase